MSVTLDEWNQHTKNIEVTDEISCRCSASRHYYVAYHKAKGLIDAPISGISAGVHEQLIQTLLNGFSGEKNVKDYKVIAYKLKAAKTLRAKADYSLDVDFTDSELETLVGYVDFILEAVEQLKQAA
jgi:uncharacterized protein (UPF0332 family)